MDPNSSKILAPGIRLVYTEQKKQAPKTPLQEKTENLTPSIKEGVTAKAEYPTSHKTTPLEKHSFSDTIRKIAAQFAKVIAAPLESLSASRAEAKKGVFVESAQPNLVSFTRLNKVDAAMRDFADSVNKKLLALVKGYPFPLYLKNEKNKALEAKYNRLESNLSKLESKLDEVKAKIKQLKNEKATGKKIHSLIGKEFKLRQSILQIQVRIITSEQLSDDIAEVKKIIAKNVDPKFVEGAKRRLVFLEKLQTAREVLPKREIETIDNEKVRLAKYQELNAKGALTRKRLGKIGGERFSLETKDGAKLDGMYLDASVFRQKLKDAGGEIVTFSDPKGGPSLQGIAFDNSNWANDKEESHLINILEALNAISPDARMLSGWTPVRYSPQNGPAKVVLVPTNSLPGGTNDHGLIQEREDPKRTKFEIKENVVSSAPSPINIQTEGGTIILSHGQSQLFEMKKDEACAFLFNGMNVVVFNYRGLGLSKGAPSDKGYLEDIETVYQFTKKKSGVSDKKILFKGLCLGGGPSAHAAARHPETNLFLDQTYSSFVDLAKETIKEAAQQMLQNQYENMSEDEREDFKTKMMAWGLKNLAPIVAKFSKFLFPDFQIAKNIAKNQGSKAIFYVHDDKTIPFKHVEQNLAAAQQSGTDFKLFSSTGLHGEDWSQIKTTGGQLGREVEKIRKEYNPKIKNIQKQITSFKEKNTLNKEDKSQLKQLKKEQEALLLSKEEALDKLYLEAGLSQEERNNALKSTSYEARLGVEAFLKKAGLSDPILA